MVYRKLAVLGAITGLVNAGQTINNVFYGNEVTEIVYKNVQSSGEYQTPSLMNANGGQCQVEYNTVSYGGPLAPLNDQITMHLRGPIQLFNFAYYVKNPDAEKRDVEHEQHHERRAHHAKHKRNAQLHHAGPGFGKGDVKTKTEIVDEYITVTSIVSEPSVSVVVANQYDVPAKPKKHKGDWIRKGYYNADAQKMEGLRFLANKGSPSLSGTWTTCFGSSLAYLSSDGKNAAAQPETLAPGVIFGVNEEFSIWTNETCDGSCGYSYATTPCYKGFHGVDKVFTFEFMMPTDTKNAGNIYGNSNMPAIWSLNSLIGRTQQYPSDPSWSCWPKCGEFDIWEVLYWDNPASQFMTNHLHSSQGSTGATVSGGGGCTDYMARPTNTKMKGMVGYFADGSISISVLPDSFDFPEYLTNKVVYAAHNNPSASIYTVP